MRLAALKVLAIVAIGAILWTLFRAVDPSAIVSLISSVGALLFLVLVPFFVGICFDTLGFKLIFKNIGRRVSFRSLLFVRLATEALVLSVSGGVFISESLKPLLLKQRSAVPIQETIVAIAARKVLLVLSESFYVGLAVAIGFVWLEQHSRELIALPGLNVLALAGAIVLFAAGVFSTLAFTRGSIAGRVHHVLSRIPVRRFQAWIELERSAFLSADARFTRALDVTPERFLLPLVTYFVMWVFEALETLLILTLLGVHLPLTDILILESLLSLVRSLVFFLPAGLGVQDLGYVAFLHAMGVADTGTVGAAFVLIKRGKELFWTAFGYMLLLAARVRPQAQSQIPIQIGEPARPEEPTPSRPVAKKKVLFICGSINQTTQMHQIAMELAEYDHHFTPYYCDGWVEGLRRLHLFEFTIAGYKLSRRCFAYLEKHGLPIDYQGKSGSYDLVVTCSDQFVPANIRDKKIVVVQEGILDPKSPLYYLAADLRILPLWLAGTAATGQSGRYDRFCVASDGYRDLFIKNGLTPEKLVVTGIPNFDDCRRYYKNDFPHKGYVLVCTSDARETFKLDNRGKFIRRVVDIANGRQIIFKLHPNEKFARARREIETLAPGALIYTEGSAEEMIANADVLICQYSSVVYVGLALGKEVHSYFDLSELRRLAPLQIENGSAAKNIASVCRDSLEERVPASRLRSEPCSSSLATSGLPPSAAFPTSCGSRASPAKLRVPAGRGST